ncbi:hypothetical protein Vi05172_g5201 [Venturia inaequalis]|nr:hypothetical protein Vi05172_g5201 [Venturia inaequalis]
MYAPIILLLLASTPRLVQGLRPPPPPGHGDRHCIYRSITKDTYCNYGQNGAYCDQGTGNPCDPNSDFPTKTIDTWTTWQNESSCQRQEPHNGCQQHFCCKCRPGTYACRQ